MEDRRYEFSPTGGRADAIAKVIATIEAASHLNLPFTVTTEKGEHFRNGGNVNKATILSYHVVVGNKMSPELDKHGNPC
jgi:hypothetical protein